jgi:hypothetical protein
MGVSDQVVCVLGSYFERYSTMCSSSYFITLIICNFVGRVTSAPDGSSPRGYSRKDFVRVWAQKYLLLAILALSYPAKVFYFFSFLRVGNLSFLRVGDLCF